MSMLQPLVVLSCVVCDVHHECTTSFPSHSVGWSFAVHALHLCLALHVCTCVRDRLNCACPCACPVQGNFSKEQHGMHAQLVALRRLVQVGCEGIRSRVGASEGPCCGLPLDCMMGLSSRHGAACCAVAPPRRSLLAPISHAPARPPPQVLDPPLFHHLEERDSLSFFFCFRWLLVLFKVSAVCGVWGGAVSQGVGRTLCQR